MTKIHTALAVSLIVLSTPVLADPVELTFTSKGVIQAGDSSPILAVGQEISAGALWTLFDHFRVGLSDECEGPAFSIDSDAAGLCVNFDQATNRITAISGGGIGVSDLNGARINDQVNKVDKGSNWKCYIGLDLTCDSNSIPGLSYIVDAPDGCLPDFVDAAYSGPMPDCVVFSGFAL